MAPTTKKAAATAVVTGLVALTVVPSISAAPASAVPAVAPAPRLTASALAALDASYRQASPPAPMSSSAANAPPPSVVSSSAVASSSAAASSSAVGGGGAPASVVSSSAAGGGAPLAPAASLSMVGGADGGESDPATVPEPEGNTDCFPADAAVEFADGRVVAMADLKFGDKVRVAAGDVPAAFSPVFWFTRRLPTEPCAYVRLGLADGGALVASAGHYVYAGERLVAAAAVAIGDTLQVVAPGGGWTAVTVPSVSRVDAAGLYNRQTLHGDVIVDGVRASTFTVAVAPAGASKLLTPLRAVYRSTGRSVGAFQGGGGALSALVPRGKAVC